MGEDVNREKASALAIDDSMIVRWGLEAGLRGCGFTSVFASATATEAISLLREADDQPELALVGLVVDQSVLTLTRLLAHRHRCTVVVLLARRETNLTLPVLQAGAYAVLERDARSLDLAGAIASATVRRRHLAPGLIDGLAGEVDQIDQWRGSITLTPREREVLDLVVVGRTNAEVAARLCISDETVKSHLTRIFHKFGVHRRTELVSAALRHGVI